MKTSLVDQRSTKQIRVDSGYHQLLSFVARKRSMTIKELLGEYIVDGLYKNNAIPSLTLRKPTKRRIVRSRKE